MVIATPPASGKSLCFHLPVLEAIAADPEASALFLYPTKALSRDQEHGLHQLAGEAGLSVAATVYDGRPPRHAAPPAPGEERPVVKEPAPSPAGFPTATSMPGAG